MVPQREVQGASEFSEKRAKNSEKNTTNTRELDPLHFFVELLIMSRHLVGKNRGKNWPNKC